VLRAPKGALEAAEVGMQLACRRRCCQGKCRDGQRKHVSRSLALCERRLAQKLLESYTEFFILRMLLETAAYRGINRGKELGVIGGVDDLEWHFGGLAPAVA
jgi:hypothetical protein